MRTEGELSSASVRWDRKELLLPAQRRSRGSPMAWKPQSVLVVV